MRDQREEKKKEKRELKKDRKEKRKKRCCSDLEGGTFSWTGFLLSVQINYRAQSVLSDLLGNSSEGFEGLGWS